MKRALYLLAFVLGSGFFIYVDCCSPYPPQFTVIQ